MGVVAKPEMNEGLAKFGWHRLDRDEGAPGRAMPERRRLLTLQALSNCCPDTVSTNQGDAALVEHLRTAPAEDAHTPNVGGKLLHAYAQLKRHVESIIRRIGERRLQVSAMDCPVRFAVAPFGVVTQRDARDLTSGAAGHHADRQRLDGSRFDPL